MKQVKNSESYSEAKYEFIWKKTKGIESKNPPYDEYEGFLSDLNHYSWSRRESNPGPEKATVKLSTCLVAL
ncbi:MAG: hypothetical protein ACI85I_000783 [Arenicella sp.]